MIIIKFIVIWIILSFVAMALFCIAGVSKGGKQ